MRVLVAMLLGWSAVWVSPAMAQTPPPAAQTLVYTPLPPCRAFDFRLSRRHVASIGIAGSQSLARLGGSPTGCGIPFSAVGLTMSVSALKGKADGYLQAWTAYQPHPVAVATYFSKDGRATAGSMVGIQGGGISLYSSEAVTVVGDVTGYFDHPIRATISGASVTAAVTDGHHVTAVSRPADGVFYLTIDRDITGCSAQATLAGFSGASVIQGKVVSSTEVYVNMAGIDFIGNVYKPANSDFTIAVHC